MKESILESSVIRGRLRYILVFLGVGFLLQGCFSGSEKSKDSDSVETATVEDHADNDIAMSVRSIIDAINVGQPLDSTDYNFSGILTDGTGRPLYTDVQGAPGMWEIKVLTQNSAVIRNLYLGDLLPNELVEYILTTIGIDEAPMVEATDEKGKREDNLTIYKTGQCDVIIETQEAKTPKGDTGPLLKIILRKSNLNP